MITKNKIITILLLICLIMICCLIQRINYSFGTLCLDRSKFIIETIAIKSNGDVLAGGDRVSMPGYSTVRFWDGSTRSNDNFVSPRTGSIRSMELNRSNDLFVTAGDHCCIWDAITGVLRQTLHCADLCTSSDSNLIATSSFGSIISFVNWDGQPVFPPLDISNYATEITAITLSGDGSFLVYADSIGYVGIIDVAGHRFVRRKKAHLEGETKVCFSNKTNLYYSGGREGTVIIWDVAQEDFVSLEHTSSAVNSITARDRYLSTGHANGDIILWNISPLSIIKKYCYFGDYIKCVKLSDSFLFGGFLSGSLKRYPLPAH